MKEIVEKNCKTCVFKEGKNHRCSHCKRIRGGFPCHLLWVIRPSLAAEV